MKITHKEIIELEKNFRDIDDEDFVPKVRLEVRRHLSALFDDNGNYILRNFDAHRSYRGESTDPKLPWQFECKRMHEFLFDDEGNLRELIARELPIVIEDRDFSWRSKAVHLHYADEHGKQTSGSYPATWMDK
ncbi:hypothetical protein V0M98_33470 (plasmid) [Pseudomonas silesiensis]|uniref:hypothetical protein n=1 Tax=Pseudomonas silesiensis TaxID=1853130 RepID=UPI0030CCC617